MAARLRSTVYVRDPQTHQTVELAPGTSPEPRLAALVKNPAAWVDGKLPRLPKTQTDSEGSTGDGQDDASGAASDAAADQSPSGATTQAAAPAAKKTAARKTAASNRSRGRDAAGEGTSGE
jgi:hypothetical protein